VWRAVHTKPGPAVAVKLLPGSFVRDADRRTRPDREANVSASLSHPKIAQIWGVEDRAIMMEL